MIEAKESLTGSLNSKSELSGALNKTTEYIEPITQEKEITPSTVVQEVTPDEDYTGLSKVTIKPIPSEYVIPSGTLEITSNGTHNVKNYEKVSVSVGGITIDDASFLFYRNARISKVNELLQLIKNCISCGSMFYYCTELTTLNLSNFDTSNVKAMNEMFYGCSNLTTLDVSNFNTSKVTNMTSMFAYCSKLTALDVNNFNTSKVIAMSGMFQNCSKLTTLDLSNWYTNNVANVTNMFSGCNSLTKLDIRNFTFTKLTASYTYSNMFNGVPDDCLIIVKDDTAKSWVTSKFSNLTNVETIAEYEAE